ncbi:hypothetical protein OHB04_06755 [Streptomyces sp. NBC_01775]|uniref:hypothetical protein n=1 Tax=Streptomyces sp. NBC_01775 TaxID=2975939 RepID=UPI002DDA4D45|nr:hypothetical protein [Streptomyces sp. NBC_01775]WSB75512.1 hypothetical protein OHB04_06755 [Streptomyces sp. NBC_01775]
MTEDFRLRDLRMRDLRLRDLRPWELRRGDHHAGGHGMGGHQPGGHQPGGHPLGRRQALTGLAASAGAAALLAPGTPAGAAGHSGSGRSGAVYGPHFTVIHSLRPVDLIAPRFVDHDTGPMGHPPARLLAEAGPAAPFAAVIADVAALPPGGSVAPGLETADGTEAVRVRHDSTGSGGTTTVEVVRPGGTTTVATVRERLSAPFRLAFTVTGHTVAAFVSTGASARGGLPWRPLLTDKGAVAPLLDLRQPALVKRLRYSCHSGGGATVRRLRAGHFGQLGLRDLHLVRDVGGRPYVRGGKVFFTAGCAGAGFSQEAHTGVWAMDPDGPERMEQVAKLFFARDGLLFGDHGGQLLHDPARDRFIVLTVGGNLPTPGVRMYHATTSADLLRGVHVLHDRPLEAPFTRSAWDPALIRYEGRWHWAYVDVTAYEPELSFRPVLAVAERGGDYADGIALRRVPPGPPNTEGCRWQHFGGQPRLLVSDRAHKAYPRLDLSMRPRGAIDAPYPLGTPFPQVFPDPGSPSGDWLLVTFDESMYEETVLPYGTHGKVVTMRAPGPGR